MAVPRRHTPVPTGATEFLALPPPWRAARNEEGYQCTGAENGPMNRCYPRSFADMDDGAAVDIGLGPAQDFARDRGGIPFPERQVLEQIDDRVPLGPIEVRVRDRAGVVSQIEQE